MSVRRPCTCSASYINISSNSSHHHTPHGRGRCSIPRLLLIAVFLWLVGKTRAWSQGVWPHAQDLCSCGFWVHECFFLVQSDGRKTALNTTAAVLRRCLIPVAKRHVRYTATLSKGKKKSNNRVLLFPFPSCIAAPTSSQTQVPLTINNNSWEREAPVHHMEGNTIPLRSWWSLDSYFLRVTKNTKPHIFEPKSRIFISCVYTSNSKNCGDRSSFGLCRIWLLMRNTSGRERKRPTDGLK